MNRRNRYRSPEKPQDESRPIPGRFTMAAARSGRLQCVSIPRLRRLLPIAIVAVLPVALQAPLWLNLWTCRDPALGTAPGISPLHDCMTSQSSPRPSAGRTRILVESRFQISIRRCSTGAPRCFITHTSFHSPQPLSLWLSCRCC